MIEHIFQCPGCGYQYNEAQGDAHEGYASGTPFADLPVDFVCPDCSVCYKQDFIRLPPPSR